MFNRNSRMTHDSHANVLLHFWLGANGIGFILVFGLLSIGAKAYLHTEIGYAGIFFLTLFLLLLGNIPAYFIFSGARLGIDGIFGFGRPVDQSELAFQTQREAAEGKFRRHEFEEAAKLFRPLVDHPKNKNPITMAFKLADIYANHLARPDDALYWYHKCISMIRASHPGAPDKNPLWNEVQRGLASFEGLRATDETDYLHTVRTAMDAIREGRLEEAKTKCDDLLRRYPGRADTWYWSGVLEFTLGHPVMAIERYRSAIHYEPNHFKAMFNLGLALRKLDQLPEARDVWTKYLDAARDDPAEAEYLPDAQKMLDEINRELK